MAGQTKDIFSGAYVTVSLNEDTSNAVPAYFDAGYITTEFLGSFPAIGISQAIQKYDDYRDDSTSKLAGDITIDQTQLVMLEVQDDKFQYELDQALHNKKLLRFRTLYAMDVDPTSDIAKNGVYAIYDAYVKKVERSGSANTVVTRTYTLEPEGQLFTGYVRVGEQLRQGDFGVGAGTEDIPGPSDVDSFQGNRLVTVDGSLSSNPFSSDTSEIVLQHPSGVGWNMIATSTGAPMLRISNRVLQGADNVVRSPWIKVFTESEKPTAAEVDAVSATKGGEFLAPVKFNLIEVNKKGARTALIDNDGNSVFASVTTLTGKIDSLTTKTANIGSVTSASIDAQAAKIITISGNTATYINGNIDNLVTKTIESSENISSAKRITGQEVYDGTVRVYSKNNQPNSDDVGALSLTGGKVSGSVEITGSSKLQAVTATTVTGSGNISGSQILEGSVRVYSPNNKPTPSVLGAVNKAGDTMTGDLTVPNISTSSLVVTSQDPSLFSIVNISGTQHTPLMIQRTGANATSNLSIGYKLGETTYFFGLDNNASLSYGKNSNQALNAKVYTQDFKPTSADVGAIPENASIDFGTF
ncbi:hypothetical protein [Pantoea sp. MBLJ3]|uniref:hypothetical protein n=1 Tax=Pantoea sp. MBLJ3 TaxID=1562889 RepID=UPI0006917ACD|nr:hypothetical protein [Pantoea sp. MBLJ3]